MPTYLEQVLGAAAKAKKRTQQSQASVAGMAAVLRAKQVAAQMAAQQAQAAAPGMGAAPRPSGGGGGGGNGPHHKHDGHNHSSSGQTVGEANELWRRLQKMIADRPTIKPGPRARSYEEQVRLWNLYKAGKGAMAARPGTSKHGNGRANDLKYGSEADRQWALANAKNYGLAFPLYNPKLGRGRDESWHVELAR